jgi:putative methionine-R-sulfoxide reductase with GAF domain
MSPDSFQVMKQTTMQLNQYLKLAQLQLYSDVLDKSVAGYIHEFHGIASKDIPIDNEAILYSYEVPKVSPKGSCSILNTPDSEYYDLTEILGGRNQNTTRKLAILNTLVTQTALAMSVDWLGIYQCRIKHDGSEVLVKLAYRGALSRAEFPLTEEFSAQSNNSTVGMNGVARIINNIPEYIKEGGPYYNCDPRVKAEACLPLFARSSSRIVGIVDAEAWQTDFFSNKTFAPLLALCIVVPEFLI